MSFSKLVLIYDIFYRSMFDQDVVFLHFLFEKKLKIKNICLFFLQTKNRMMKKIVFIKIYLIQFSHKRCIFVRQAC
jgi:hypothetical protein